LAQTVSCNRPGEFVAVEERAAHVGELHALSPLAGAKETQVVADPR
jgi:hypothetical protein